MYALSWDMNVFHFLLFSLTTFELLLLVKIQLIISHALLIVIATLDELLTAMDIDIEVLV